ncbi:MAG: hypothetical protein V5B78_02210 [Desulfohalobiaceae bacterium]
MRFVSRFPCLGFMCVFFLVALVSCSTVKQKPSPAVQTVRAFNSTYGTPAMDRTADIVTPEFRDGLPKSVWVMKTWNGMQKAEYKRVKGSVLESEIKDDRAVVVMNSTIETSAGQTQQNEIFTLIRRDGRWLIDGLAVTDEEISSKGPSGK